MPLTKSKIEQIKSDVAKAYPLTNGNDLETGKRIGYIAGATAQAEQAQKLADALNERCNKMAHLLYMLQSVHSHEWSDGNQENVKQTLQQWNEGKEAGDA